MVKSKWYNNKKHKFNMIKEKLNSLYNKDLNSDINKSIIYMNENYSETDLLFILSNNGIKISENIILKYYNGYGFICLDINERITGKSPLCQNVERFLNRKQ